MSEFQELLKDQLENPEFKKEWDDNIPHSNLRPTKSLGVPGTGSADIAGFMGFHKKRLRQEASSFL